MLCEHFSVKLLEGQVFLPRRVVSLSRRPVREPGAGSAPRGGYGHVSSPLPLPWASVLPQPNIRQSRMSWRR